MTPKNTICLWFDKDARARPRCGGPAPTGLARGAEAAEQG